MLTKHPIIAIIGSSGAGKTFIKNVFKDFFKKHNLTAIFIEGDGFHKYSRAEMNKATVNVKKAGRPLTHFAEAANHLDKLNDLFVNYKKRGTGQKRYYIHNQKEATEYSLLFGKKLNSGEFTPWEEIKTESDVMFYEGLHGGFKNNNIDIASKINLLIGINPVINLEWMQKIHRDTTERHYKPTDVYCNIIDRMHDYVKFITPQFENTHINFHRVPLVDTHHFFDKNTAKKPPPLKDSLVVNTFRTDKINLKEIKNNLPTKAMAFLQNKKTLVYRGDYLKTVLNLILINWFMFNQNETNNTN